MKRRFWFHYNKPESKKAGEPRLTLHFKGKCHLVSEIRCHVPTWTRNSKRQPRCVMVGDALRVFIVEGKTAVIL